MVKVAPNTPEMDRIFLGVNEYHKATPKWRKYDCEEMDFDKNERE